MDKSYIKQVIQRILDKEFSSKNRRKIVEYEDRFNFCAPCCGDSHKNEFKKRGNLYLNKLRFVCFNCGKGMAFDRFCRDFNEQLDPDKKLEMIEHLNSVVSYSDYENNMSDAKFENLIDLSRLTEVFNSNLTTITDFRPIVVNGGVYKYLIGRGIGPEHHKNIWQAKYWRNEDEYEWVIAMLNSREGKILGMQIRNLKEGKRRMFKIYNYESLLEISNIGREAVEIDINEMVVYNKLSYYFNILNVDFGSPITVFEGYIDSLFFPNSVGLVGVNTDGRMLENNGLELRYFFDNDQAGLQKSEQKMRQGFPVFLWKKLFSEIVERKRSSDPFMLMNRISKVKDMNKLAQLVNDPYTHLSLENYFSIDLLDIKWIPKFLKFKKKTGETDYSNRFKMLDRL